MMAYENIAAILGRRIDRGEIPYKEALNIAKMWLGDNPKSLYRLKL